MISATICCILPFHHCRLKSFLSRSQYPIKLEITTVLDVPVQNRPFKPMTKGHLQFTPIFSRWQIIGRETSSNNERYTVYGKTFAVVHKTHHSLEKFRGASGPCHYVLYTASDSREKLLRLAKKPRKFSPSKVLPYTVS